ncbi:SdpI family protein [Flexivirga sp. B27]
MGLTGGIGLLACAAAIYFSTWAAARGSLPRGIGIGIRTATTQHSDEAWVAAHRAALPCASVLAAIAGVLGIALMVAGALSFADTVPPMIVVLFVLGYGVVLIGAWPLVRIANNGALDAGSAREQERPS